MLNLILVRHGTCDIVGKAIAGRMNGIHLNDIGRSQVQELATKLSHLSVNAIYTSPLERTLETAALIAHHHRCPVHESDSLLEIDYGEWTGLSFEQLNDNDVWHTFNSFRAATRIPGGEMMIEVQARMAKFTQQIHKENENGTVIIVSHGDPLKALLCYYMGIPIDNQFRFTIEPASLSIVSVDFYGCIIRRMNDTGSRMVSGF